MDCKKFWEYIFWYLLSSAMSGARPNKVGYVGWEDSVVSNIPSG